MPQLEHIEAIERRLWSAADTLRANSSYASNEYFLPVMGLVFLRHAYSRYLAVRDGIVASLPSRGGKTRELTKEDFSQKSAIYLRPEAQFDYLVALPDSADRAKTIITAMESIEADYLVMAECKDLRDTRPAARSWSSVKTQFSKLIDTAQQCSADVVFLASLASSYPPAIRELAQKANNSQMAVHLLTRSDLDSGTRKGSQRIGGKRREVGLFLDSFLPVKPVTRKKRRGKREMRL